MDPIRWDGDCAVFTFEQVVLFGEPTGYSDWIVISNNDDERPMVLDWKYEHDREKSRPIHRYSRIKRFEWILYQLIGARGKVPTEIVEMCIGCDKRPEFIWASILEILKREKLRVYYNRIGSIIYTLTGWKINVGGHFFLDEVVRDFSAIKFVKGANRKYFPNLRFIALKMLIRHGAVFEYHVPLVQTKKKLKGLEILFDALTE